MKCKICDTECKRKFSRQATCQKRECIDKNYVLNKCKKKPAYNAGNAFLTRVA